MKELVHTSSYAVVNIPSISSARAPLKGRYSCTKQEYSSDEDWTDNSCPFWSLENRRAEKKNRPPNADLTKVVRMAGHFPRTHVTKFSLVLWVHSEVELELIGDSLKDKKEEEQKGTKDDSDVSEGDVGVERARSSG